MDAETDVVILSRETKATTIIGKEYQYNGVFSPKSLVNPGSIIETDESFLVQTLRSMVGKDKYCSLIKTNVVLEVQRYHQEFDGRNNPIGDPEFKPVQSDIKAFVQFVTAQLRQDDPGLLPSTSHIVQVQTTVDVKDPQDQSLLLPDRIHMNGIDYQVDAIDTVKYPNLLHIQLSEDRR